jgi:hypothetical protein
MGFARPVSINECGYSQAEWREYPLSKVFLGKSLALTFGIFTLLRTRLCDT